MGSFMGRVNQCIQLVKVLYCKLPTNSKQLPAFPLEVGPGREPRNQRWEAIFAIFLYTKAKPKTWLRPFMNMAPTD